MFICSSKRPKLDQVPAASLDADDPLDEENSDDPDSDDDTAQLLAELQRIKKERALDQAKQVSRDVNSVIYMNLGITCIYCTSLSDKNILKYRYKSPVN